MAINIEPLTFNDDGACYHTEDLVLITESGNRLLTLGLAPGEIPSYRFAGLTSWLLPTA